MRVHITLADAAAAVGVGARLATANVRHFPMPDVEIEPWPGM